jgi:hypothetical protein
MEIKTSDSQSSAKGSAEWFTGRYAIANAVGYAKFYSHSHDAVIGVFDLVGNTVDAHEQAGDFKEW